MPTKQKAPETAETLNLGAIAQIPTAAIMGLPVEGFTKNGVVLVNERIKVTVIHDNRPIIVTASLYVQRDALNEAEQAKVEATAAERKTATQERELAEDAKRQREVKRAYELGQQGVTDALRNIDTLASAAKSLAKLNT